MRQAQLHGPESATKLLRPLAPLAHHHAAGGISMRQPVRLVILVAALLFPTAACSHSELTKMSATSEVSAAGAVADPSEDNINPMAEQAAMALALGGLAAMLKRRKPGSRS